MGQSGSGPVALVIKPQTKDLGEFAVRRSLPDIRRKMVGPFIFFDHMGPAVFSPGQGIHVRQHPHIGIATITYLFDGNILHRDSLGYEQVIEPGAVNWMTAGNGIVHSEQTPPDVRAAGSTVHGIQSWVALPDDQEDSDPAFDHYPSADIPAVSDADVAMRVVIGSAFGVESPVQTLSPTLYVEIDLSGGASVDIPADYEERALYVVEGQIVVNGTNYEGGTMLVLNEGPAITISSGGASKVMLLGGAPLGGERKIWWNFVSSSSDRIDQAKADWREGRFARVEGESEYIPLPGS